MDKRISPVSNNGHFNDGVVSWVFNARGGMTAIVRYTIEKNEASITIRDDRTGDYDSYTGDAAYDMIKLCLGYVRRWIFKEEDGKWLFIHPKTEMWLETKYFITCFRFNRERKGHGHLIERLLYLLKENGLEEMPDDVKKSLESYGDLTDSRCFGWYEHLEDAVDIVENNRSDIHECAYTYAVIEEVSSGPCSPAVDLMWFKWNRDDEAYISCDKPAELERITGFCF